MTRHRNRYYVQDLCRIIISFTLMAWCAGQALAQAGANPLAPGTVVAGGHNAVPTGRLKVKSYRLEALGEDTFRLSVSLEDAFINGALLIWINDDPLAAYHTRRGELSATFPLQWLEDGAIIAVSKFGTPYELTLLPEKLKLPEPLKRATRPAPDERMRIASLRRTTRNINGTPQTFIGVVINSPKPFYPVAANNTWVIQIGRKEFAANVNYGDAHQLACSIALEEFAELQDGDPVRVNWGFRALPHGHAGKSFEVLDKSRLKDK